MQSVYKVLSLLLVLLSYHMGMNAYGQATMFLGDYSIMYNNDIGDSAKKSIDYKVYLNNSKAGKVAGDSDSYHYHIARKGEIIEEKQVHFSHSNEVFSGIVKNIEKQFGDPFYSEKGVITTELDQIVYMAYNGAPFLYGFNYRYMRNKIIKDSNFFNKITRYTWERFVKEEGLDKLYKHDKDLERKKLNNFRNNFYRKLKNASIDDADILLSTNIKKWKVNYSDKSYYIIVKYINEKDILIISLNTNKEISSLYY